MANTRIRTYTTTFDGKWFEPISDYTTLIGRSKPARPKIIDFLRF
jgi:hypothetical protein